MALGAVPVVAALLISVPMLLRNEIPTSAANQFDHMEIEYTRHQLKTVSHGIAERTGAQKTEVLLIRNDGSAKYSVTEGGYLRPDASGRLAGPDLDRLRALIKETGFATIPSESFPVMQNVTEYQKSNVKVTLNGQVNQIHWPEQAATARPIPPIITMVEAELDRALSGIAE